MPANHGRSTQIWRNAAWHLKIIATKDRCRCITPRIDPTTNVEMHGRVSEHTGKYDTLMEIVKKRKRTLFGYVLSAKETLTNTILQGKVEGGNITRKANKTEVGRCKRMDRDA